MPIAECAGVHGCQRAISISVVPGGNPAANADPEGYASQWTYCPLCKSYTCDRCLARQQNRCRCGAPARLYTEAERIRLAQGGPPPDAPLQSPPPDHDVAHAVRASARPSSEPQLRMMLEGIAMQVDGDLARSNLDRARAMASLAATLMLTQGLQAPICELPWLLWYGESFYRWKLFAEGAEYWKGIYQLLTRLGRQDAGESLRAVATAGAFQVLSGEIPPEAPHAQRVASFVQTAYGPDHVLTKDVFARLGLAPTTTPASWSPQQPPSQAINLAPQAPRLPPEVASLDGSSQLALWITLAFLDVASADGTVDEREYLTWKQTMAAMQLPDVWARFGAQGLQRMLQAGVLHALSADFATLPEASRAKLAGMLVEFMIADGRADPAEVQAVKRIGAWLGVSVQVG